MFRWLLLFVTISSTAFCQQLIEGRVVDKETGNPVPFASIGIIGTSQGTSSNLNGQFSLALSEPFSVKISCVGYESLVINSLEGLSLIRLKPIAIELNEIIITRKKTNPKRVVQLAFSNVANNYDANPFLQKFFYRHYCMDDLAYGRLIEASVEVLKHRGYKSTQGKAGDKEEIRVTQLRRSLDNTIAAQGHEPIAISNILQADIVGYQTQEFGKRYSFYHTVSNLKTEIDSYTFTYEATTVYDGQEVYLISYASKKDSVLTTSGYIEMPSTSGTIYITTDRYAIVKNEETKMEGANSIRTSAYYRQTDGNYYPYHFIREGESYAPDNSIHSYHIELMSTEIARNPLDKFIGREPGKEELLKIPYDSVFWKNNTILKTTPLEDQIIHDLGGGESLNRQFYRYQQYEWSISHGGQDGEAKFNWFREHSKGNRIMFLIFWDSNCELPCFVELEHAKRLQKLYQKGLSVVLLSLDNDETRWKQLVTRYNLFADGIINYRIGSSAELARHYKIKETPAYILLTKNGDVHSTENARPGNALLENEIRALLEQ